jgi:hypothetical protein
VIPSLNCRPGRPLKKPVEPFGDVGSTVDEGPNTSAIQTSTKGDVIEVCESYALREVGTGKYQQFGTINENEMDKLR